MGSRGKTGARRASTACSTSGAKSARRARDDNRERIVTALPGDPMAFLSCRRKLLAGWRLAKRAVGIWLRKRAGPQQGRVTLPDTVQGTAFPLVPVPKG